MDADLVEADTQPLLQLSFRNKKTKILVDLTGYTIVLRWKVGKHGRVERNMIILDPTSSPQTQYRFGVGELLPGTLEYEATLIDSSGRELTTTKRRTLDVRARIK